MGDLANNHIKAGSPVITGKYLELKGGEGIGDDKKTQFNLDNLRG